MKGNTAIKLLLAAAVIIFVGHQLYSSLYMPVSVESAVYYETVDGLNISGTVIRNEYYVTSDTGGVYHYLTADGERVAAGGIIADIYDSESASVTMSNIDTIKAQIADITELQGYNNQQATDIKLVQNHVDTALNSLIRSCAAGRYSAGASEQETLLSAINRRQIITGEQTDFSGRLAQLNEQLGKLNSALDFMKELQPAEIPANVIGKVVTDYEWYIAAKVTINDSMKYKTGDTLTLRTSLKSSPELDVTVNRINLSRSSDSAVIIFSCNQMNSELASMRTGAMTVVNKLYKGLKLAKRALRVVDSKTGVYVLSGITLKFVPVNVLYSNDDYIICEQQQSNDTVLRLYDRVVVKGKKLYDGKVVG